MPSELQLMSLYISFSDPFYNGSIENKHEPHFKQELLSRRKTMSSADWNNFIAHFNAGRYVECVVPLEHLWFAGRDDFYKGLIRLCVGLNQLQIGLITSPRFLLQTAHELLAPYAPQHHELNIVELQAFITACLIHIPSDLETGQGRVDVTSLPTYYL